MKTKMVGLHIKKWFADMAACNIYWCAKRIEKASGLLIKMSIKLACIAIGAIVEMQKKEFERQSQLLASRIKKYWKSLSAAIYASYRNRKRGNG